MHKTAAAFRLAQPGPYLHNIVNDTLVVPPTTLEVAVAVAESTVAVVVGIALEVHFSLPQPVCPVPPAIVARSKCRSEMKRRSSLHSKKEVTLALAAILASHWSTATL